jgi:integrase
MGDIKLTDRAVADVPLPEATKDVLQFDAELKGFGLRVTKRGARIFLYQYRLGPKVRRIAIGEWPTTTAIRARKLAETLRGAVKGGADPVADAKARRSATLHAEQEAKRNRATRAFTVGKLIDEWQAIRLSSKRSSYRTVAPKRLRVALADWVGLPASELTRSAVVRVLDHTASENGAVSANRLRAYGRAAFGWAFSRGTIDINPFDGLPKMESETPRDRVLSDPELARIWAASELLAEPWRSILLMLILTGQRRGEVTGMAWEELSDDRGTWTLPSSRTKNAQTHDVPLSQAAQELVRETARFVGCGHVFSRGRPKPPSGFGKVKVRLDALLQSDGLSPPKPWRLHDIRRSVATGLQRLGVRLEVTEAILNHTSGSRSGIVGVYQRHKWTEEKKAALDAWANHVTSIARNAPTPAKVVSLRAK